MNRVTVLDWNLGSIFFQKWFKGVSYKGNIIEHQYFQPVWNGELVSRFITENDPDILIFQEIYKEQDLSFIPCLLEYPHKELVDAYYQEHAMLFASKFPFERINEENITIFNVDGIHFIPVHMHAFSANERLKDAKIFVKLSEKYPNVIIVGDTNIWNWKHHFLFENDKETYGVLTKKMRDHTTDITSTSIAGFPLDRVFAKVCFDIENIRSPRVRGIMMDHYPILFDIKL